MVVKKVKSTKEILDHGRKIEGGQIGHVFQFEIESPGKASLQM